MFIRARPTPFIFPGPAHAPLCLSSLSLSRYRLGPTRQRLGTLFRQRSLCVPLLSLSPTVGQGPHVRGSALRSDSTAPPGPPSLHCLPTSPL
jgi:hypothetical protein